MKRIWLCMYLLVCVFFHTGIYAQEPMLPTGQLPAGTGHLLPVPLAPEGARPLAPPSGSAQMGGVEPASLYFAAGAISPDGKNLYVSFDRYLIRYSLPELKLIQKVDIGLPVVPVTPSIFLSPDSNWIYIIQNGTIFQIEKISFKIKSSEKLHP
ncbi:MAG: hypothetical protein WCR46_08540 [Deltaproteobacteria bacterium]|jgi:hypothetical protein